MGMPYTPETITPAELRRLTEQIGDSYPPTKEALEAAAGRLERVEADLREARQLLSTVEERCSVNAAGWHIGGFEGGERIFDTEESIKAERHVLALRDRP